MFLTTLAEKKFLSLFILLFFLFFRTSPFTQPPTYSLLLLLKEVIYPPPQLAAAGFNFHATSTINIYRRLNRKKTRERIRKIKTKTTD